ncbi:VOC family protein [Aurantimonas marianensis]|uniref:VOC family protein n=1 Tax=Aurantimonas marianensis TaxID=2920428 RepID=A0A9X2H475_9HYPH|nr:VOC family protein [Aurantimonas marianensis]MCP3053766.1 VOC family protein [Aurantimonas marianensis]
MHVYINLPVADLDRSRRFFSGLGFDFNDKFSDHTGLAMRISDTCTAMLLTHEKFATFTPRRIADSREVSEVLTALQLASREAVDRMTDQALASGGEPVGTAQDHGFMYGRAFSDPDGHIWEPIWMNPDAMGGGE